MTPSQVEILTDVYLAELPEAARAGPAARGDARFAVERIVFVIEAASRTGGLAAANATFQEGRRAGTIKIGYRRYLDQLIRQEVLAAARRAQ